MSSMRSVTLPAAFAVIFIGSQASVALKGTAACTADTFIFPELRGTEHFSTTANEVHNFSSVSLLPGTDLGQSYTVDFCNVSVNYGHTGWNDSITVSVWLPLEAEDWSSKLLSIGGGGTAGTFGSLYQTAAIAMGHATSGTDAGHEASLAGLSDMDWALSAAGNAELYLIKDWGTRSLEELSVISKAVTAAYFDRRAEYSYFTGCSGGGRQAMALAQHYPSAYNGLLAVAPAIAIESFLPAVFFAAQTMYATGYFPSPCEVQGFTAAAIEACDGLDGVLDGIISDPEHCSYSAHYAVGQMHACETDSNSTVSITLTAAGATVVEAAWTGPVSSHFTWPGFNKNADLTVSAINTACTSAQNTTKCTRSLGTRAVTGGLTGSQSASAPSDLFGGWFQYLVAKDPDFDVTAMKMEDFSNLCHQSVAELRDLVGAWDPHLEGLRASGGRMISWHGMADTTIPPRGSKDYFDTVLEATEGDVGAFYRHFEAPGVGHCFGGEGPLPNDALKALMAWVEQGTVPETLLASSQATGLRRPLCPYPQKQTYVGGGSVNGTEAFKCV